MAKRKSSPSILPPIDSIPLNYSLGNPQIAVRPSRSLAGQVVSINCKAGVFFSVGDIELSPKNYWAIVSDNQDDNYYDILQSSIDSGTIVLGKQYIPPYDKPKGVIDEYFNTLKSGKTAKAVEKFKVLVKKGSDRHYTVAEIATGCMKIERNTKNREDILKFLQEVLSFHEGQFSYLQPADEEEGKVQVQIKDGQIVSAIGDIPPSTPKRPANVPGGSMSKEDALGQLFS